MHASARTEAFVLGSAMFSRIADKRGVVWFLGCVFVLTYSFDFGVYLISKTHPYAFQIGVAASMFFPALCAILVSRFISERDRAGADATGEGGEAEAGAGDGGPQHPSFPPRLRETLTFGPRKYYLLVWLTVPVLFAIAYAITWATGIGRFDPHLHYIFNLLGVFRIAVTPQQKAVLLNPIYIPVVLIGSLTYGPLINSLAAFGEELGWRGFLWPRLAPMGFWPATIVSGVIWGLWHAVIVALLGFNYPGHPVLGVIWMCLLTTVLGTWMNWLMSRTGSTLLASWVHGVFNSQGYGIWRALTYPVNDLVGGFTGLIGLAVLALPTIWLAATGRIRALDPSGRVADPRAMSSAAKAERSRRRARESGPAG